MIADLKDLFATGLILTGLGAGVITLLGYLALLSGMIARDDTGMREAAVYMVSGLVVVALVLVLGERLGL